MTVYRPATRTHSHITYRCCSVAALTLMFSDIPVFEIILI